MDDPLNITRQELDSMLEQAAQRGAERAIEKFTNQIYQEIGRTVMKKFLQAVGALILGAALYGVQQGWFK